MGGLCPFVFKLTTMSAVINSVGWIEWSTSDPNTDHVTFGEYDNEGAGAQGTRASFATKLTQAVAITQVLGSSYEHANWVDTAYIS